MTAKWEGDSRKGSCLYAASWSALKKLHPLECVFRMFEISARWSHEASLMGVSTTHARFVMEWRKSSQARSFSPCYTPNLKATLISGSFKTKGSFSVESGKWAVNHPSFCCERASPRSFCAFFRPDFLDLSEKREAFALKSFSCDKGFFLAILALAG